MKFDREQKRQIRQIMKVWFSVKCQHEDFFRCFIEGEGLTPEMLANKVSVDIDHSSMLNRLLDGKRLLPEPPPVKHSYPVYPD